MALSPGDKLGPYEILGPAGAGGMGEVYKATDTRLGRTVALKVLPSEVAGRAELRERLSREAKAVSSLNHPHICALYDVGHQEGTDYLVMEFLEGETLATRLEQGPLPLDDLLKFAIQIADALATAHRKGLVHRDLKPGNVMLTGSGAKLLDFGLAKSFEASAEATSMTAAATATSPLTAQGTIVGTFQYMAPEQLEGGAADARSDIFAFGAVLYEMATGRRAFEGKTQASLVASILKEAPRPLTDLAPMSPPALQRLVATCLEKDPEARRQTMNDVLLDLRWIQEGGSQAGVPAPVSRRRRRQDALLAGGAAVAVLAAVLFAALWWQASRVEIRPVVTSVVPPPEVVTYPDDYFALSPDGRLLVYAASGEDKVRSLWLHSMGSGEARPIQGTQNGIYPFWSPDSRHIGFFSDGKLRRVDVLGGPTQVLAEAAAARGGTWGPDGTILFTPRFRGPLFRVPESGGPAEELTTLDEGRGETSHRWPWFLPDGHHALFLSQTHEGGSSDDKSRIEVLDLETREHRELFLANSSIQYAETGHILFWSQGAVYAQPFDAPSLELTGEIFPVADQVQYTVNEMAEFSVDRRGNLVYQTGSDVMGISRIFWIDRSGGIETELTKEGQVTSPALSPDGTRMAYEDTGDIWIADLERGAATRLTFDGTDEYTPVWSPDGRWVAFTSNRGRNVEILRKQASGLGAEEVLFSQEAREQAVGDWLKEDGSLLLAIDSPESGWDLWRLPAEGGEPTVLVQSPFPDVYGRYAPGGEYIAYSTTTSGRPEVYVIRLSGPGGRWQISTSGGRMPEWRGDGKELYFLSLEGTLMSVEIALGEEFKAGIPQPLFEAPFRQGVSYPYDPAPDGQRFLVNLRQATAGARPLTLVQNWLAATRN